MIVATKCSKKRLHLWTLRDFLESNLTVGGVFTTQILVPSAAALLASALTDVSTSCLCWMFGFERPRLLSRITGRRITPRQTSLGSSLICVTHLPALRGLDKAGVCVCVCWGRKLKKEFAANVRQDDRKPSPWRVEPRLCAPSETSTPLSRWKQLLSRGRRARSLAASLA